VVTLLPLKAVPLYVLYPKKRLHVDTLTLPKLSLVLAKGYFTELNSSARKYAH
jgi:hypothetical protein